jgi:hypothetical protein
LAYAAPVESSAVPATAAHRRFFMHEFLFIDEIDFAKHVPVTNERLFQSLMARRKKKLQ